MTAEVKKLWLTKPATHKRTPNQNNPVYKNNKRQLRPTPVPKRPVPSELQRAYLVLIAVAKVQSAASP